MTGNDLEPMNLRTLGKALADVQTDTVESNSIRGSFVDYFQLFLVTLMFWLFLGFGPWAQVLQVLVFSIIIDLVTNEYVSCFWCGRALFFPLSFPLASGVRMFASHIYGKMCAERWG